MTKKLVQIRAEDPGGSRLCRKRILDDIAFHGLVIVDRRGACSKRNPEIFGLQDCKNDKYLKYKENKVLKPFNKMLIMLYFDYEKLF